MTAGSLMTDAQRNEALKAIDATRNYGVGAAGIVAGCVDGFGVAFVAISRGSSSTVMVEIGRRVYQAAV